MVSEPFEKSPSKRALRKEPFEKSPTTEPYTMAKETYAMAKER